MIDLSSSYDLKNAHFLVKASYLKWTLNKACSYYLSYDTSIDSHVPFTRVEQNSSLMDIALKRANLFEAETEKFKLYQLSVQLAKPMIQACSWLLLSQYKRVSCSGQWTADTIIWTVMYLIYKKTSEKWKLLVYCIKYSPLKTYHTLFLSVVKQADWTITWQKLKRNEVDN